MRKAVAWFARWPGLMASIGVLLFLVGEFLFNENPSPTMLLGYVGGLAFLSIVQVYGGQEDTRQHLDAVATQIGDLTESVRTGAIYPLKNPDDVFEALVEAMDRTSSDIRLMKVRKKSPLQFDAERGKFVMGESGRPKYRRAGKAMRRWYRKLPQWAAERGHRVQRIIATSGPGGEIAEMKAYAEYVERQMHEAAANYIGRQIRWDFRQPALNLCIFDEREAVVTLFAEDVEHDFKEMSGIRIVHGMTVRWLTHNYYERMKSLGDLA